MQEFDNLIKFCANKYNSLPFCQNCQMNQCKRCNSNNCNNCLAYIHLISTKKEHYSCEKITYNYILKYGYKFVSEMAWAFYAIKNRFNTNDHIDILSVGCGPSTELYGALAIFNNNISINYYGFDLNDIWKPIQYYNISALQNCSITYLNCDFLRYIKAMVR